MQPVLLEIPAQQQFRGHAPDHEQLPDGLQRAIPRQVWRAEREIIIGLGAPRGDLIARAAPIHDGGGDIRGHAIQLGEFLI